MTTEQIIKLARECGAIPMRDNDSMGVGFEFEIDALVKFAALVTQAERDRICAAIKAEDDHCSTGDYMLDSDDCIKVVRGQWQRPDYGNPIVAATQNVKPTDWTAS